MLLILCLLATFKSFSQTDIKSYVILTEGQAKSVAKDILHMEALEAINVELEKRINNFVNKEFVYKKIIITKDTIIDNKDKIIFLQNKIINKKKPIKFHSYLGIRSYNFEFDNPIFYYDAQLEFKKMNIGAKINFQPVVLNEITDGFYYNIYVEYKLF